ncbi:hypothetical protein T05_15860 [Trichinella murrelli]|uniref:Uncharacterized protein n=1 Tax=Trichinella murrelli TaxID=144512 RepID=A0A0V0T3P2_9BILA|nr:hypothetical protein T05_15860 [Trichinella murrelli]
MQITIAITLPYHQFNEWSKENVKTRTTRSRTREEKRLNMTSSLENFVASETFAYAASVLIF